MTEIKKRQKQRLKLKRNVKVQEIIKKDPKESEIIH